MAREERIRDHISGVYRISVQRLDGDQISLSTDSGESEEGWEGRDETEEDEEELSESESESSDDSDIEDGGEDVDMRRLVGMKKPHLLRIISLLRGVGS